MSAVTEVLAVFFVVTSPVISGSYDASVVVVSIVVVVVVVVFFVVVVVVSLCELLSASDELVKIGAAEPVSLLEFSEHEAAIIANASSSAINPVFFIYFSS